MSEKSSYSQIVKSSSIMGGAAGISMLLGIVRTKFAAVLMGTTGIGLLTSFTAVQGLIGVIAGLGIQSSAVREVAVAVGKKDDESIGRAVLTMQRISLLTGLFGMIAMIILSPFLSQVTFDSSKYTVDIATLGVIILLANISGGQMALMQGMRRIGDMAKANIIGAAFSTVSAIGFYLWLGLRGIVPSLVVMAVIQLVISWHFAKRVPVPLVKLSWRETFTEASGMVRLGLVFMWTGLLNSVVVYITITLITQQISLQSVGIYSAAFALSGMFINFILQAMAMDYYPRLTGAIDDKLVLNQMVNEQTEIGLLLAVPGLILTMVLAPWIVQLFYTSEFLPAVQLIEWFILGSLIRVIQWPIGFLQMALGRSGIYLLTQTTFSFLHAGLILIGLKWFGIEGVAIAFFILYIFSFVIIYLVARYLTDFVWTKSVMRLTVITSLIMGLSFIIVIFLDTLLATILGFLLIILISIFSLRELSAKLGPEHKLTRFICRIPILKKVCYV